MKGRSSSLRPHTESSRKMRGAWRTACEYILELHTEQRQDLQRFCQSVGCDGQRHPLLCRNISARKRSAELISEAAEAGGFPMECSMRQSVKTVCE